MENSELDFKSVLEALMSDDKIADTVKQLKTNLTSSTPNEENEKSPESQTEYTPPSADLGALAKILSFNEKASGKGSEEVEKRNRLLSALKPYLRDSRRDVIDKVMSISRLTGLVDLIPKSNS